MNRSVHPQLQGRVMWDAGQRPPTRPQTRTWNGCVGSRTQGKTSETFAVVVRSTDRTRNVQVTWRLESSCDHVLETHPLSVNTIPPIQQNPT